eukprot:gene7306-14899_t
MQVLGNILKGFVNPFVITVFCGIVCLFPIFAGFELSVNPDSPMALGFKSYQYQFSIVSGIAVGFPMLLDYAFDRFGANHLKRAKGLIPRRDVTLALIVPNIILIAYVLPFEKYSYLPCITKARECFYSYSFFLYASKHCRPIWTKRTVSIPLVAFGISNVIGCINPFYHGAFNPILNILQPLFAFITVITFARLYYLYSTHIREDKTLNSKENHYQNSIYINSAFTLGIFFLILNYALDHDTWETTGYLYLTLYTYSLCIFATVVTVLNGRIVRIEAAQTQAREADVNIEYSSFDDLQVMFLVKRVISETDRDRDRDRDRDAPPIDGFETDEDGNVCESYDTFRLQVIDTASVSINTDVAVIGRNINPTATEMESNLSSHHGELRDRDKKKVNQVYRVQLVAPLIKVASSNSVSSSSSSWRISSSSPVVPVVAAVANRPPLPPLIMPPIGLFSSIPSVKVVVECLDDENHDHHCDNDRDRDRDRVSSNMASLI